MKKILWINAILFAGCIEPAPSGSTDNVDGQMQDLYDCSDCVFEGVTFGNSTIDGRLPDRARCEDPAPNSTPFVVSVGTWSRSGEVAAAGVRCVDFIATWETDAFLISRGNNVRDLRVAGTPPTTMDALETKCAEGWLSGLEFQTRDDVLVAVKALCGEYRVEVLEDGGELTSRVRRRGIEPGEYVPNAECADCEIQQEICPEGSIAEGFQTKLQPVAEGSFLTGFDVVCVPITAQISQP